jgi:hypothetical protein
VEHRILWDVEAATVRAELPHRSWPRSNKTCHRLTVAQDLDLLAAATSRNNVESGVFASCTPTRTLGVVMNLVQVVPGPSTLTIGLVPVAGDHSSGARLPVMPTPAVGRFVR